MRIGYARCSTATQDLEAQRNALEQLSCDTIFVDHGLTGRNRDRPGLAQALAGLRAGGMFGLALAFDNGEAVWARSPFDCSEEIHITISPVAT